MSKCGLHVGQRTLIEDRGRAANMVFASESNRAVFASARWAQTSARMDSFVRAREVSHHRREIGSRIIEKVNDLITFSTGYQ
jgi:hypothetical protein